MRINRLFIASDLNPGQTLTLPPDAAHYLRHVLRLKPGHTLILFNGKGGEYTATLSQCQKTKTTLTINDHQPIERESPLNLTLAQAIAKPEHMDYAIQKAVELGVTTIIPLLTERSVPIEKHRIPKREQHWQKIIQSACEQCGRNRLPDLQPTQTLTHWLSQPQTGTKLLFIPDAQNSLSSLKPQTQTITLLIGAEGGLTPEEIQMTQQKDYQPITLGPRILRTETATIITIALCQSGWGDIN